MVDDDPSLRPARVLVEDHLALADSTWVVGIPRAQAGFARSAGERAQRGPNSVLTERGDESGAGRALDGAESNRSRFAAAWIA